MEKNQEIKIGDKVGYDCIPSLMNYKGTVVELGSGPMAIVCWHSPRNEALPLTNRCTEYVPNLRVL